MACPTIDKLSCYADDLLSGEDLLAVRMHIETCCECQEMVDLFKSDEQLIRETLSEPTLPENFADHVLSQLQPKKKKRSKIWQRTIGIAAGLLLAVGMGAIISPSFSAQISSLFLSEEVDEGLQYATELGLTERLNLTATDKGITFKIEDVIVDTSRIALSHQILNEKGQVMKIRDLDSETSLLTEAGEVIELNGEMWRSVDDSGVFEFLLPPENIEGRIVIQFKLTKINGVTGDWQLEVPIETAGAKETITIYSLDEMENSVAGVILQMKGLQYSPFTNTLMYETCYTEQELERINSEVSDFEEKYNLNYKNDFKFGTDVQYHIKNEKDEVVFRKGPEIEGEENRSLTGTGSSLDEIGHMSRIDSFSRKQDDERFTFVLDAVTKVIPTDFSIQVNQSALKKQPITFNYDGHSGKIMGAEKVVDYYFAKSFIPLKRQKYFRVSLNMEQSPGASEFNTWALIDEKGRAYETFRSGSTVDMSLYVYGLDKLPENFTLKLLTVESVEALEEQWEVPLYK